MTTLDTLLAAGPPKGESHRWIAKALVAAFRENPDLGDRDAVLLVSSRFGDGHTPERLTEIRQSIANARACALRFPLSVRDPAERWKPIPPPPKRPSAILSPSSAIPVVRVNPDLCRHAEEMHPFAWTDLCHAGTRAPNLPEYREQACLHILASLYQQQGDFVCAGPDPRHCLTQTLAEWSDGILDSQHLVPNPMAARTGTTKAGRVSPRSLDNAAKVRRYLVVEFDHAALAQQASRIAWLDSQTPGRLLLIMFSGGKSLHAWFCVRGIHPARQRTWFRLAATLGADPQMWLTHQPARMPCGIRQPGGIVQETLLWRPEALETGRERLTA